MLNNKNVGLITREVSHLATLAWYGLFSSVVLFLLLKIWLVLQAFLFQFNPTFVNRHLALGNSIGWTIGILGLVTFVGGFFLMVQAAVVVVGT